MDAFRATRRGRTPSARRRPGAPPGGGLRRSDRGGPRVRAERPPASAGIPSEHDLARGVRPRLGSAGATQSTIRSVPSVFDTVGSAGATGHAGAGLAGSAVDADECGVVGSRPRPGPRSRPSESTVRNAPSGGGAAVVRIRGRTRDFPVRPFHHQPSRWSGRPGHHQPSRWSGRPGNPTGIRSSALADAAAAAREGVVDLGESPDRAARPRPRRSPSSSRRRADAPPRRGRSQITIRSISSTVTVSDPGCVRM